MSRLWLCTQAIQNTLCPNGEPSPHIIEVLDPEEKPVYTISIIADGCLTAQSANTLSETDPNSELIINFSNFSIERVSCLPPYLIDRKGNLLKKVWHRSCNAGYAEITSKHLSHIAADSGLVIKLMAEKLEVSQACICGDPPPFIVDNGGVYKRDHLKLNLAIRYAQVVSEYLSNIVVV